MSAPNVRRVPANHQAYLRATLIDIPSQPTVDSFMETPIVVESGANGHGPHIPAS